MPILLGLVATVTSPLDVAFLVYQHLVRKLCYFVIDVVPFGFAGDFFLLLRHHDVSLLFLNTGKRTLLILAAIDLCFLRLLRGCCSLMLYQLICVLVPILLLALFRFLRISLSLIFLAT